MTLTSQSDCKVIPKTPLESPTPNASQGVPIDGNRRLKHLSEWTNADVMKWLERHYDQYNYYGKKFCDHRITGRSLCHVTDFMLNRVGIDSQDDRNELRRVIMKLKLKSDMVKLKDLERHN